MVTALTDQQGTTPETAGAIAPGRTVTGIIETEDDRDWYAVQLVAGQRYRVTLSGAEGGGGDLADPDVTILNADGSVFATGGAGALDASYLFSALETGTYFISAGAEGAGASGSYTLSLSEGSAYDLIARDLAFYSYPPRVTDGRPISGEVTLQSLAGYAQPFSAGLHLSTDAEVTTDDYLATQIATSRYLGSGSAETKAFSFSFDIGDLDPGTYYAAFIADDTESIAEYDETNNISNLISLRVYGAALPVIHAATDENTAIAITDIPVLADGTATLLGVDATSSVYGATITMVDGALVYAIDHDPFRISTTYTDQFFYDVRLADGTAWSGRVEVAIKGINDAPVAQDDAVSAASGEVAVFAGLLSNDSDVDGLSLGLIGRQAVSELGASVEIVAGAIRYDPTGIAAVQALARGETLTDSFWYRIGDGAGGKDTAVVTVTIAGSNQAPVAGADDGEALSGVETRFLLAGLLANDADPEGDAILATGAGISAQHGTAWIEGLETPDPADDVLVYRSEAGFTGTDEIVYQIGDGHGGTAGAALSLAVGPGPIGEVLQVSVDSGWSAIAFAGGYVDPVVFAISPGFTESDAVVTRLRDVTGTGAEIRLQETKFHLGARRSGEHGAETVTIVVLEKGVHTLSDGTVIEVGATETWKLGAKGFDAVDFTADFAGTPAVFTQVQTYAGTDYVLSRTGTGDTDGFAVQLQEEAADNLHHAAETVGWFAVEAGSGSAGEVLFEVGRTQLHESGVGTVFYATDLGDDPLAMAALRGIADPDPAGLRLSGSDASGFGVAALEDTSVTLATSHGAEDVDWIAFSGTGFLF